MCPPHPRWNLNRARDQLNIYLNILGFRKGGSRKYKASAVESEGWPDEISFINFEHPSNEVEVTGNVGSELSAYEKLRQANINEREAEMERLGVVPHSQVRQEWENSD